MINKLTRHLGQKYRGDHRPRTRPNSLQTCSTSPRMVILSIPRLDILGCSSPFTRDIGPGLSPYTAGTQGKIGPHTYIYIYIFLFTENMIFNSICSFYQKEKLSKKKKKNPPRLNKRERIQCNRLPYQPSKRSNKNNTIQWANTRGIDPIVNVAP